MKNMNQAGSAGPDFSPDHFQSRSTANKTITGKNLLAAGTLAFNLGEIFDYTFFKAFHQSSLTAFAVVKEFGLTAPAGNGDPGNRTFFIGFSQT